jgi:hypothetical protein
MHRPGGKYGAGFQHCIFCYEDKPYHREYCPWQDFFFSPFHPDPMVVEEYYDAYVGDGCEEREKSVGW